MKIHKIFIVLLSILIIVGCKENVVKKKSISNDRFPYGVGDIYLGMDKELLRIINPPKSCEQKRPDYVECNGYNKSAFFSGDVGMLTFGFYEPYKSLDSIDFFVEKTDVTKESIQKSWGVKMQCITSIEIEKIQSENHGVTSSTTKSLIELGIILGGTGEEFLCLSTENDNQAIKVGNLLGKSKSVKIYYMSNSAAQLIRGINNEINISAQRNIDLKSF